MLTSVLCVDGAPCMGSVDQLIITSPPTAPQSEFVNRDLWSYSAAANARSIPSAIDGLKPAQRKVCECSGEARWIML